MSSHEPLDVFPAAEQRDGTLERPHKVRWVCRESVRTRDRQDQLLLRLKDKAGPFLCADDNRPFQIVR